MLSNSRIIAAYREKTPASEKLAQQAGELFPSGITHDSRYLQPYGIYTEHAQGSRKWDVDGHEYVDYFGGHGALLLGHNHPQVLAAVHQALDKGTHFGTSHESEIRWAQQICAMVPSAERVRFTASGTEATHLALRLARAYTGKRKLVRVKTHFHGWHDHMTSGWASHFDGSATSGVLQEVAASVVLLPPEDTDALRNALSEDDDIAAAIIEPTGSAFGRVPVSADYLRVLRTETENRGIVLIFDEVVTGFRVAPGGAQAHYGITPDLTTLAKIVAGGLPGGAVVGRRDLLERIDFRVSAERGFEKIAHPGTFNANPVSAAAGCTALQIIAAGDACVRANEYAARLRDDLNDILEQQRIPWAVYGTFSGFHIFTNPNKHRIEPKNFDPFTHPYEELKSTKPSLSQKLQLGMLLHGVHINGWPGGIVSAAHTDEDRKRTVEAFRNTLKMLREEKELDVF
jgi:glutamate-1-semialdehyde 2,1-aminomutase